MPHYCLAQPRAQKLAGTAAGESPTVRVPHCRGPHGGSKARPAAPPRKRAVHPASLARQSRVVRRAALKEGCPRTPPRTARKTATGRSPGDATATGLDFAPALKEGRGRTPPRTSWSPDRRASLPPWTRAADGFDFRTGPVGSRPRRPASGRAGSTSSRAGSTSATASATTLGGRKRGFVLTTQTTHTCLNRRKQRFGNVFKHALFGSEPGSTVVAHLPGVP